jgi:deoxyribodipyrimidine photo-lyase
MSEAEQRMHGVRLGEHYPQRIVDHEQAARDARARLSEVRRLTGFRVASQRVYAKHGSRKRTLADDHPARTKAINARKAEKARAQMQLEF